MTIAIDSTSGKVATVGVPHFIFGPRRPRRPSLHKAIVVTGITYKSNMVPFLETITASDYDPFQDSRNNT